MYSFLSSLAYQQYFLVLDPAQKGGSMEPQEPP